MTSTHRVDLWLHGKHMGARARENPLATTSAHIPAMGHAQRQTTHLAQHRIINARSTTGSDRKRRKMRLLGGVGGGGWEWRCRWVWWRLGGQVYYKPIHSLKLLFYVFYRF